MELNDYQKEILRLIVEGTIYDLKSFVQYEYKDCKFKYDLEKMKKKKQNAIDSYRSEVEEYANSLLSQSIFKDDALDGLIFVADQLSQPNINPQSKIYTQEDINSIIKKCIDSTLDISTSSREVVLLDKSYWPNPFNSHVYRIDNTKLLILFLKLWDMLLINCYISNCQQIITNEDASLFFKSNNLKTQPVSKFVRMGLSSGICRIMKTDYEYTSSDLLYSDIIVNFNKDLIPLCEDYLGKKIEVKQELYEFIECNFVSPSLYSFTLQRKLTYLAVGSSIILSIVAIFLQFINYRADSTYWQTNEEIEHQLVSEQNELLESVTSELNSINIYLTEQDTNQTKITESTLDKKIDQIIEELEKLNTLTAP